MIFIVQRMDCDSMGPAYMIDPEYADKMTGALQEGVEAYAYQIDVSPTELRFVRQIPVVLS